MQARVRYSGLAVVLADVHEATWHAFWLSSIEGKAGQDVAQELDEYADSLATHDSQDGTHPEEQTDGKTESFDVNETAA